MKVHFMRDYMDRFGVFHEAQTVAEMPDHIAVKLLNWRIARPVSEPDPPPKTAVTTAAFAPPENTAPQTVKRAPSRPKKG